MIKNFCFLGSILFLIIWSSFSWSSEDVPMKSITVDIHDKESLQRGAKMYMNYCSGCHSLKYMRYNRMAKDLGLTTFDGQVDEDLLKNNLIFTQASMYDPIEIAMPPEDAKQWFGMVPPDLSLSARNRGSVWIYNYLKSFYRDDSRPFHSNNLLIPDVAMPNVLAPLIGTVILKHNNETDAPYLLLLKKGSMYQDEFDSSLKDLVNFLVYVAEPAQLVRYRIGSFVLAFLAIFLVVAYRLKKIYWKKLAH